MLLLEPLWLVCCGNVFLTTTTASLDVIQTPLYFLYNMFERNLAIENHTVRSVNVTSPWDCFRHCARECECVTFQLTGNNCELLDTGREHGNEAVNLVYRPATFLYSMQHSSEKVNGSCFNGCCQSKPCMNGGTCEERCNDVNKRYTCACSEHYQGKRCEIFRPRVNSCQAYLKIKPASNSGVVSLYTSPVHCFQTYCDFDSEAGKAWTVIESFSRSNKAFFKDKPFNKDFPQNEDSFNWNNFRLSNQSTALIRDNSSHWRVTCNFPSGLSFSDYARASLKDTDILTFVNQDKCQMFEYISVRNTSCSDCRGMLVQKDDQHMHIDSYWSGVNKCAWDAQADAVRDEDNFGFYNVINPQHKCTANSLSTTQWWLGSDV